MKSSLTWIKNETKDLQHILTQLLEVKQFSCTESKNECSWCDGCNWAYK